MHDTHFLERLPRASYGETEMALGLYRKPELVSEILTAAAAPEVERVAIALGPGDEPSWLIVARDGGFVTCLGSGMSPGAWPRISHATVTRIATRHEALRSQIAHWAECAENGSGFRRTLRELYEAGERVSRETISAIMPLGAMLWPHFIRRLSELDKVSRDIVYNDGQRLLRRRDRLSSYDTDQLRRVWVNEWAKAHIGVLIGGGQRDFMEFYPQTPELEENLQSGFTLLLRNICRFGFQPHVVRALWFASRFGKLLVRSLKAELAKPNHRLALLELFPTMALAAIASRREKLKAEIAKALDVPEQKKRGVIFRRATAAYLRIDVAERAEMALEPFTSFAEQLAVGNSPPVDWATLEEPQRALYMDVSQVAILNFRGNVWTNYTYLMLLLQELPWVVRLAPGDFYSPKVDLAKPWQPAMTLKFLEELPPENLLVRAPVRAEPKPGRNDLCACGSGKKFKRCCA